MDYTKIGNFIMSERKAKKLTQAKLAEKLFVSEKTISKWENGNGIPDTNTLQKLCNIFEITINELLNGERFSAENYENKAENILLQLQKTTEENNKMFFRLEIVLVILGLMFLFSFIAIASFVQMANWLRIILIIYAVFIFLLTAMVGLRIEQVVGFYECRKCKHKFIPTFKQVNLAMHIGRTRYMKCPKCNKKSWCRKVLK
ncbi:MAG: helix-turn-helix domain-containing protein [Clostridiales bacterium]|nr:helix-turn-helix domain-containing protein [Clostridiales bacterium]